MAATQLNVPTVSAINYSTTAGLGPGLIGDDWAGHYVRKDPFHNQHSSKFITYNLRNTPYLNDDEAMPYREHEKRKNKIISTTRKADDNRKRKSLNKKNQKEKRFTRGDKDVSSSSKYKSNSSTAHDNYSKDTSENSLMTDMVNSKNTSGVEDNNNSNNTLINLLWSSSQTPLSPGVGYGNNDNNNSSTIVSSIPTNYIIVFSTLFFLIGTIGISGNVLVVYIVLSDGKMRRSMTNMMILNLALADSLIMLFGIPEIVMVLLDQGWQLGHVACSVNRTVLVCALYASVLTLVSVCIERYIAIVFPIKAHILCTKRRVIVVIGFIWLFSIACSCPAAVFNTVVQISNTQFCLTKFHDNRTKHEIYLRIYKYTESALFYIGPLIIQVVCYAVIGKRLFVDLEKLHRSGGGGGGISSASRPNGRGPTRAFNEAMRARKGVVKMLMASVAVYCLSYSPHQILLVYNSFSSMTFDKTWVYLVFTTILAYVNSAANPFLYCVFSDNFRTNFKRILHNCIPCKFCCCCEPCSSCVSCNDQKPQRPMTLHSYTEYTSLVRRNTQKQGQAPIITV